MPFLEKAPVVFHRKLADRLYLMEFYSPQIAEEANPGQFINLRVNGNHDPLLRRPISIFDVNRQTGCISLFYKVVGHGTALMADIHINDEIDVMGPLGRGFQVAETGERVIVAGGGMGIAPLFYLTRRLKENGALPVVLYGAENLEMAVALPLFRELEAECMLTTADGSGGRKGLVTVLLDDLEALTRCSRLYCCGPVPMMNAFISWARGKNLIAQFSLEEHMACGVGACLGCACKLKAEEEGYAKVCKDGPVFDLASLGELGGGR